MSTLPLAADLMSRVTSFSSTLPWVHFFSFTSKAYSGSPVFTMPDADTAMETTLPSDGAPTVTVGTMKAM